MSCIEPSDFHSRCKHIRSPQVSFTARSSCTSCTGLGRLKAALSCGPQKANTHQTLSQTKTHNNGWTPIDFRIASRKSVTRWGYPDGHGQGCIGKEEVGCNPKACVPKMAQINISFCNFYCLWQVHLAENLLQAMNPPVAGFAIIHPIHPHHRTPWVDNALPLLPKKLIAQPQPKGT